MTTIAARVISGCVRASRPKRIATPPRSASAHQLLATWAIRGIAIVMSASPLEMTSVTRGRGSRLSLPMFPSSLARTRRAVVRWPPCASGLRRRRHDLGGMAEVLLEPLPRRDAGAGAARGDDRVVIAQPFLRAIRE